MTKSCVYRTPYLSKHTSFHLVFVAQVKKDDISRCSFYHHLMITGLLGGGTGVKSKKCPNMTKKIVSLGISGTVPNMIVGFGTHM